MKALILNSGLGHRMGVLTSNHPKCMTEISSRDTILSRQLRLLCEAGIQDVVITTGYEADTLKRYCLGLGLPLSYTFRYNPLFRETNYIYSIFLAREELRDDDILLMHGDLVFDSSVLEKVLGQGSSCMAVSSTMPLPEKDFRASVENGRIVKVGVGIQGDTLLAAQPLYLLRRSDWNIWLEEIGRWCEDKDTSRRSVYAENALNEVSSKTDIRPLDLGEALCCEVDTPEDLERVSSELFSLENRDVYMCFSTDIIHSAHISIIRRAARLGRVTIGVLSDEAVSSYKRFPLVPFEERKALFRNIAGVWNVVEQKTLSYRENLEALRPRFVVHGDDWKEGFQRPIRDEVIETLSQWGGELVEFPYGRDPRFEELDRQSRQRLSLPDMRRSRLRKLLSMKGLVRAMEAHSGLTGLLVEETKVLKDGKTYQFDAMWLSSLCDSTLRGKPDIELVDLTSRISSMNDIMEVTTKPVIFDADTGGLAEHFAYTVKTLERLGVSMIIVEDKTGLKKNSLFGTEVAQTQDTIENFCEKLSVGKAAKKTSEFMICARIESLILEKGIGDALERAFAYTQAGADAIMIHSRKKDPGEVFSFVEEFRKKDTTTPIVVVPTSYSSVYEEELRQRGVNIVIYANQFTRSAFPAMKKVAESILLNQRALEADSLCMSIKDIITLIPEDNA